MSKIPMQVPYGAVYFRKSNPPRQDWERDYAQAARDGNNIFRHWFMWGSVETAPGVYDWEDYDRQLELAEKYGIKTILAEKSDSIPEWLYAERPDLLCRTVDGGVIPSSVGVSSATGGYCGGLCLDKEEGRALTAGFLQALAARYKGHPALLGFDVWNECATPQILCYCDDTAGAYRVWLQKKYGDLVTLGNSWNRNSYTDWSQVKPPRRLLLAAECFDWLEFRKENAHKYYNWRIDVMRSVDPDCLMSAHGMGLSLENMALGASDEWLAAAPVEVYGLTFVQSRKGAEAWKQFCSVELTRAGARGKPFWHAEAQGGPLWLQPQVTNRPREDGRITKAPDLRVWNLTSFACGARGILYPRWRPLLDGPLFGAFGPYGMDGLPTACSDMGAAVAKWANAPAQARLMQSAVMRGEIGIPVIPEAQSASKLLSQSGGEDSYVKAAKGAYRSFFDNGIQADFVHMDHLDEYEYLYLPYPLMLKGETAARLASWAEKGGRLISEGCPGYFGDGGHVNGSQPAHGLDKLFGVEQAYVEFTPDLLKSYTFNYRGHKTYGGEYLAAYRPTTGQTLCEIDEGALVVENSYGRGKTMLVGTCPSVGYMDHGDERPYPLPVELAKWLGMKPRLSCDNPLLQLRLSQAGEDVFLWVINQERQPQRAYIELGESCGASQPDTILWNGGTAERRDDGFMVSVGAQDALILQLK